MSVNSLPKFHDVIAHLVDMAGFDEHTKNTYHQAVNDHYKDDIEALTDEEKSARRAPIDLLAGAMPAVFVGGITQGQLDSIIAKAIDNYKKGEAAKAALPAPSPSEASVAPTAAALVTPTAPAISAEDQAAFNAWKASQQVAPTASTSSGAAGTGG